MSADAFVRIRLLKCPILRRDSSDEVTVAFGINIVERGLFLIPTLLPPAKPKYKDREKLTIYFTACS